MSNGWDINTALAVTFAWVTAGTDLSIAFPSGTSPVNVGVPSGTYRMGLAPTTGPVLDFIRVAEDAINAEMVAQGRAEEFTLRFNDDGRLVLTCIGGTFTASLGQLLRYLGWTTQAVAVAASTATNQPFFLFFSVSAFDGVFQIRQDGAEEETSDRVYSFGGDNVSYKRQLTYDRIPWDPTRASEVQCPATPYLPLSQYMNSIGQLGTARQWSMLDVWWWARNAQCALTIGDWQVLRTSTTTRYFIGTLAGVLAPQVERMDAKLPRWLKHTMGFVLPTAGSTETRA